MSTWRRMVKVPFGSLMFSGNASLTPSVRFHASLTMMNWASKLLSYSTCTGHTNQTTILVSNIQNCAHTHCGFCSRRE